MLWDIRPALQSNDLTMEDELTTFDDRVVHRSSISERAQYMARIVVQALHSDGEARRWTLSERIVTENLDNDHYVTQLIERLSWATADAEALESRPADLASHDDGEARHRQPPIQSPDSSRRFAPRSAATGRRVRA
jgi:hypothetical protein